MGIKGLGRLTGIVDQGVDSAMLGLDMVTRRLDGVVTGQLELESFDGVGQSGTLMADGADGGVGFEHGSTAHDDMVATVRLEQGFDDFIADAVVAPGHQDNGAERHPWGRGGV